MPQTHYPCNHHNSSEQDINNPTSHRRKLGFKELSILPEVTALAVGTHRDREIQRSPLPSLSQQGERGNGSQIQMARAVHAAGKLANE
jgi:hypothetical protein